MHRMLILLLLAIAPSAQAEPLEIFVSVAPLNTFVEKIAGKRANVHTMVLPGYNPATYEPSTQQIAGLARASLYIRVGVPFENAWMQRIQSVNSGMHIFDIRQGLELRKLDSHSHEHNHVFNRESEDFDPHIWTSPLKAKQMLASIRDLLIQYKPQYHQEFKQNYQSYSASLDQLDRFIMQQLQPLKNRRFLVFHPSWGYFSDHYGLEQIVIEKQGKEPGARALAGLIDQAKQQQIKTVFVQPQFSRQSARQVADAIDGRVIAIDPLSADYIENLRSVAQQLSGTLK